MRSHTTKIKFNHDKFNYISDNKGLQHAYAQKVIMSKNATHAVHQKKIINCYQIESTSNYIKSILTHYLENWIEKIKRKFSTNTVHSPTKLTLNSIIIRWTNTMSKFKFRKNFTLKIRNRTCATFVSLSLEVVMRKKPNNGENWE